MLLVPPMERADIATMANALREALLASGPDVRERRTVTGQAFLLSGRPIGQIDHRPNTLRARLWVAERERRLFEARPTYDAESGWLHVVSDDDVAVVAKLAPAAYRAVSSGTASATPSAPREIGAVPPRPVTRAPAPAKRVPPRPARRTREGK